MCITWTEGVLLDPSQQRQLCPPEFPANPSRHDLPIYLAQVCFTYSQPTWAVDSYRHPKQPGHMCLTDPARVSPTEYKPAVAVVSYQPGSAFRIPDSLDICFQKNSKQTRVCINYMDRGFPVKSQPAEEVGTHRIPSQSKQA